MSGYCDGCGNTQCICDEAEEAAQAELRAGIEEAYAAERGYTPSPCPDCAKMRAEMALMYKAASPIEQCEEECRTLRITARELTNERDADRNARAHYKEQLDQLHGMVAELCKRAEAPDFAPPDAWMLDAAIRVLVEQRDALQTRVAAVEKERDEAEGRAQDAEHVCRHCMEASTDADWRERGDHGKRVMALEARLALAEAVVDAARGIVEEDGYTSEQYDEAVAALLAYGGDALPRRGFRRRGG